MTSMLPPTRDLPPGRQARIRAEVERAATRRGSRRLAVPILAAAAAVAVVTAGIVVLRPTPSLPVPAVQITTSPATPSAGFGVPQEAVEAIETGCTKAAGMQGRAKLHQLLDEQTRWALLYTDKEVLLCSIGSGGKDYRAGFGKRAVALLPGHFSVEGGGATAGGMHLGPAYAGTPGYREAVGRIDSKVARVTVTADGNTVDAKIANGTYALRMYYSQSWVIPQGVPDPVVRAYDAGGTLLGTSSDLLKECFFDPATGEVVYGDKRKTRDQCRPASPWK
ncbi:hypothetical protein SK854_32355 [Lentzea sp. BCCO 10_0061]|uniref:Lipoprotein n=1 Tax=Lentzea sokolovensis TaxID=3095429 RepID=A0ABU4V4Y6_9PSEU|nr:hypothetical protein [Lentzea sp. BCCO 10_0061]MDX8146845.1 hypothetical protein [Lentzea sp. BCCO 10_0061]